MSAIKYDNDKLIQILEDSDVNISNRGNICLNDLVENVMKYKNPKLYMSKVAGKWILGKNYYVTPDKCFELLETAKFRACKDICTKIYIDDGDKESIIDVEKEIFQVEGRIYQSFFVKKDDGDWDVYVKASTAADQLEYNNKDQAIRQHVDPENKMTFLQLCEKYDPFQERGQKKIDKKTIFINLSGFCNLIHGSTMKFAKRIKKWIDDEVLPSLIKYGKYIMQPKTLDIKDFYESETFSDYDKIAVVYIAYVGKIKGEHIFKYGWSKDAFRREYKEHRKKFDTYQVVLIAGCENCIDVEALFKKELLLRNLYRSMNINDKPQTELFTISTKYPYEFFIEKMKELIEKNPLPGIKEANVKMMENKIQQLEQSQELRKMEIEFESSENFKLKVQSNIKLKELEAQRDIRIKEIEYDTKIAMGNIEIELQKERNKQIAMERGYDLADLSDKVINKPTKSVKSPKKESNVIKLY